MSQIGGDSVRRQIRSEASRNVIKGGGGDGVEVVMGLDEVVRI